MYNLYEKIPKSKEYPYGVKKIEEGSNPFLEGPCLLSIAAVNLDKSIFGVAKEGMKMARMRVRDDKNAGFTLEDFPVKFLSIKMEKSPETQELKENEILERFVSKYMEPLVINDGEKIDIETAMKRMRNVNIMSYCDGTVKVQEIENILINRMKEVGYTEDEIKQIQSQMCMFPIATNRIDGKQKSTCISFHDINDLEVNDNITQEERETVEASNIGETMVRYSENEGAYLYNGSGTHNLKKFQLEGKAMSACLTSVITKALENSIENSKLDSKLNPISMELLTADIDKIMEDAEKGESIENLKQKIDENLIYGGARRITDYEAKLMDQLDLMYDNSIKTTRELEITKKSLEQEKEKNKCIMDAVEKNTTDLTTHKILMASGYQFGSNSKFTPSEIIEGKSDKQIIEEINSKGIVTPKDIAETERKYDLTTLDDKNAKDVVETPLDITKEEGERDDRI
ncbi:MAG: hypothetical protein E7311_07385 [Clostridiales bacterium]|nr:hypothetical protein [Clostridiales bacterium]